MAIQVQTTVMQGTKVPEIAKPVVRRVIRNTYLHIKNSSDDSLLVDVTFAGESVMRQLNKEHREVDSATDVLSFGQKNDQTIDEFAHPPGIILLGDVIICPSHVSGFSNLIYGIAFVASHGTLHLLDYEHGDKKGTEVMNKIAEEVLADVLPSKLT